jgi:hypothetical protein
MTELDLWLFGLIFVAIGVCIAAAGAFAFTFNARLSELRTDVDWIKSGLRLAGDKAGFGLHGPHSPEFDHLIEQFWHGTLTREGAKLLCEKLTEIIHENPDKPISPGHPYSAGQKAMATQMLAAVAVVCRVGVCRNGMTPEIPPRLKPTP